MNNTNLSKKIYVLFLAIGIIKYNTNSAIKFEDLSGTHDRRRSIVMATDGADGEIARSARPRDDLRPKSGDSLKVHTIKYSRATAIKAVYHATVGRKT